MAGGGVPPGAVVYHVARERRRGGRMTEDARGIEAALLQQLEDAWSAGDGAAFTAPFTEDVDFVDIRGAHHRGRTAVAHGHQAIFATIYRGSTARYELVGVRPLGDEVLLAHAQALLAAPDGPLAGEHRAMQTLVLARRGDAWQVAAFHNTLVAPPAAS